MLLKKWKVGNRKTWIMHEKNRKLWKYKLFPFTKVSQNRIRSAYFGQATTPYPTHGRDPTTARGGRFELLGFPSGPIRASLVNLGVPGSPRPSILTPSLVRTPIQHDAGCSGTPVLKASSNSSFPVAWITGPATDPSCQIGVCFFLIYFLR